MGFFGALVIALAIGFGLYFGLSELGREIHAGLVESANASIKQPPLPSDDKA